MKILSKEKIKELPRAVLFDTDNTLYPYDPAHLKAINAVREKVKDKFSISENEFDKLFQKARENVKQRLRGTASSHSRLLYFQRLLEMLGLGTQVLTSLDLEQTYWRSFLKNAELFSGVKDLLDDLRILGIPTAVVTDLTTQIQFRKIVYFGLDNDFDYIVSSEEAGFDKPHESPFQMAVEKLGVKDKIWMVGDNAKNDIWGAKNTINAVTFQKIHEGVIKGEGEHEPDAVFTDFHELRLFLQKLK